MAGNSFGFGLLNTSVLFALFVSYPTAAQIVPDATLPTNSTITQQGSTSVIEGGTRAGGNLFHSFESFSVPVNTEAFFNNALDIQNIFSRVTGNSISNIDGLIRANGTANLFLLNPNGIIFGPNARLNIGGSFLASTASSLQFADGTFFSGSNLQAAPLLTISIPIGLQVGTNPGSIINRANAVTDMNGYPLGLEVPTGKSIAFVGGDIALEGGGLNAPGGRIELGGLAGEGTVGLVVEGNMLRLNFPSGSSLANVTLNNDARTSVRGTGGGEMVVNANNLTATNGGRLIAGTEGVRNAGDIIVNAHNITLSGMGASERKSGFYNQVLSGASGNGGSIVVNTGSLSLADRAFIGSEVLSGAFGNAGNIFINTDSLSLTDGAIISSGTFGFGNGANILVVASGNVSLSGRDTAISSNVNEKAVAQGWVINNKGEVVLIDKAPTVTPHRSWLTSLSCQASSHGQR